jgi:hypothetical protein
MPCHPHHLTRPSAAVLGTTSALLREVAGHGAVVRREAACGIAADNLLTDRSLGRVSDGRPHMRLRRPASHYTSPRHLVGEPRRAVLLWRYVSWPLNVRW